MTTESANKLKAVDVPDVPAPVEAPSPGVEVDVAAQENYFNRELSQLQFNYRVLKPVSYTHLTLPTILLV